MFQLLYIYKHIVTVSHHSSSQCCQGEPASRDDPLPKRPVSDESSPSGDQKKKTKKEKKEKKEKNDKKSKKKKHDPDHEPIKGPDEDGDDEDDEDFGLEGLDALLNPSGGTGGEGGQRPSKRPATKKTAMKKPSAAKAPCEFDQCFLQLNSIPINLVVVSS